MKIEELFKTFLDEIEQAVSINVFNLWFSKIEPVSLLENKLKIKVPMQIHKNMLSNNYKDIINSTLYTLTGQNFEIDYITEDELLEEEKENTPEIPQIIQELTDDWETNLNPNYTFESFVVGDSNRLAVVSAHAVAEHPGTIHNPLFLYGKSGIGKTHLMHAIGNYIVANSNKKVLYITSNDFVADYTGFAQIEKGIDSIEYAKNFKNKYQNVDVLIIDDIQFLVGADKSQQEFFHTFNALYQANKQIIISSDRSPDDLKKIEDRLRSRFMWGLPVDIYPPDFNLRCKIINSKIKNTSLEDKLSQEIIEYIANSCQNDIRFIEGTIKRLMAYTAMMVPEKIDLNFAIEALKDYLNKNIYADSSITKIQKVVADYFNITVADLKSKKKTSNIAKPRHIAIYLCRVETDEGLARIGLEFGGRDHSTISASYDKITNDLKIDEKLNTIVKEIKNKL
ncbi:MAG: chromosomal replication initiator protein DnaA [Firmicutes bacterium]|nr:chromosomal replication initiator protein DnaA [Bacillota bacterium]